MGLLQWSLPIKPRSVQSGDPCTNTEHPPRSEGRACELELSEGAGPSRLERWHFDPAAQLCRRFFYKGAKGNANNFLSREACQQRCPGESAPFGC